MLSLQNKSATLYIGNLASDVSESVLLAILSTLAPVERVEIAYEEASKFGSVSAIAFFPSHRAAEQACHALAGRTMFGQDIVVRLDHGVQSTECRPNAELADKSSLDDISGSLLDDAGTAYEHIYSDAPLYFTTVRVSNIGLQMTKHELASLFQQYGHVSRIDFNANQRWAHVCLDTHANATMAILGLQGIESHGCPLKLSWAEQTIHNNEPTEFYTMHPSIATSMTYPTKDAYIQQMAIGERQQKTADLMSEVLMGRCHADPSSHGWNQYFLPTTPRRSYL